MTLHESRLTVVDALRGFAIVSIMLLHNIEHFDFYFSPAGLPAWMVSLDKVIWGTLFFLFGGKSYAIFALLFGLTFFIQSSNQEKRGKDFRGRFAWRLVLLFVFGFINSAFYEGDILTIYAVIGFVLIPVAILKNKTVFWIALVLMLQPYEWINFFIGLKFPDTRMADPVSWSYFGRIGEYITGNSVVNTWVGNLTTGKTGVIIWNWENGRVFQTASLFMFGMLAGRRALFIPSAGSQRFWKRTLIIASLSFIPLFITKNSIAVLISSVAIHRPLVTIISSWSNMAFMLVLVSGFVLLFQTGFFHRPLNVFSSFGRMSLSNYILQSLVGSFIYYGFGLGLYQYTGATYCLLIGLVLAVLQGCFSSWWFKHHQKGPLEALWHKGTWVGSKGWN
ncbi:MAG: DUF418 domain-containing protein [Ignavibacteriae bacterium]|nr:MAG: DUF418 domain-containing protein [Ignavibacteriota bacterium]